MGRDEKQAPLKTPVWEATSTLEKLGKLRINFHAFQATLRVCLHGGRVPQMGEVTRLGGVTRLSI